ncbi:MAG TPA: AGE family epimerase/isomerase [Micromonosporaceae bacterium]
MTLTDEPWRLQPGHLRRLEQRSRALLQFARASVRPEGGFWWLDGDGNPDPSLPLHTWIATRMTHVFALANLLGEPDTAGVVDHGIRALTGLLRDPDYGGWFASVDTEGAPVDADKAAYPHAFVVLAASSAVRAGRPGAAELLSDALAIVSEHFWDDEAGRTMESWSRDWSTPEAYRGANSSMHMVEAFLAAGDATGDQRWNERALRISKHLIHRVAAGNDWRLPEHFAEDWTPLLDYNADHPADPFRPYGYTIGHALEWSRLLIHVEAVTPDAPSWLLHDATALFAAAVERGWAVDGADGFVYTRGWDDEMVVRQRMHWVVAEGIAAAAVLSARTGDPAYDVWYRRFWDFAEEHFIAANGGWQHELDETNKPAATIWQGKPDTYHAYQATVIPTLPITGAVAGGVVAKSR